MSYPIIEIARKVIASTDVERGDTISNLKLQKLLYYLQGFFIAIYDRKLFDEEIIAWQYGPVVQEAYYYFKDFGNKAIEIDTDRTIDLDSKEIELFNEVLEEYGQYSAVKLMHMTHEESPWKIAFNKGPNSIISYELLKDYFKTQVAD
jgi:uncharacterized phage-associated protein